jgi:hypothetical protein
MRFDRILQTLFPKKADNSISGLKITVYIFAGIVIISTIRSLIHILAPDGGAGSIAGMDLTGTDADGIIFAFGLWGSSQLLFAGFQLLVLFRYRSLIPLMYLFIIFEVLLRVLVGRLKPVSFVGTPPGALGNIILLPLALFMLFLCLADRK